MAMVVVIAAVVEATVVVEAGVIVAAEPRMQAGEHELHLAAGRASPQWEEHAPQRANTR